MYNHAAIWYLLPVTHHSSTSSITVIPVFSCAGMKLELHRQCHWTTGWMIQGSNPGWEKKFFFPPQSPD